MTMPAILAMANTIMQERSIYFRPDRPLLRLSRFAAIATQPTSGKSKASNYCSNFFIAST